MTFAFSITTIELVVRFDPRLRKSDQMSTNGLIRLNIVHSFRGRCLHSLLDVSCIPFLFLPGVCRRFHVSCLSDTFDLIIHIVVLALIGLPPAFNTNLGLYHVIRFVQMERVGIGMVTFNVHDIFYKGKTVF